jgi:hypothetical protein
MKKLMLALGSLGALASKSYCPDCGEQVGSNGCCSDCGYGEEDSMDSEHESMETQTMLDLRDTLQSAIKLIDRMIVDNAAESDSEGDMPAPAQTTMWVRQGSQAVKS